MLYFWLLHKAYIYCFKTYVLHIVQAGLPTRLGQWWEGIPFLTSAVVITCGTIYLICLLTGYDSFHEICFLPLEVVSRFQGVLL